MAITQEFNAHSYTQLPPDSTGKKAATVTYHIIEYDTGTRDFAIGETVVGATSTTRSTVAKVTGTTASGQIVVAIDRDSPATIYTVGEVLWADGTAAALHVSEEVYHLGNMVLTSGSDPLHILEIDQRGQAFIRFAEGEQQLSARGATKTTDEFNVLDMHFYNSQDNHFTDVAVGAGSNVTAHPDLHAIVITTDTGSSDSMTRTSNKYTRDPSQIGYLLAIHLAIGDAGKNNVVRRWGAFDDNDGYFFELDGTNLYTVTRTSISGSPVDTRVAQADWDGDTLDGFGITGTILDVSKVNVYKVNWFTDSQVQFIIEDPIGSGRIILHHERATNTNTYPLVVTSSLPVRLEQYNKASVAGTSEMRASFIGMALEGGRPHDFYRHSFGISHRSPMTVPYDSTVETPLCSMRPQQLSFDGTRDNRVEFIPKRCVVYNSGPHPVFMNFRVNPTLSGDTWTHDTGSPESLMEIDVDATSMDTTNNDLRHTHLIKPDENANISLASVFSDLLEHQLRRHADASTYDSLTISAETSTDATIDCDIYMSCNWEEIP